jgi:hypothetical protein
MRPASILLAITRGTRNFIVGAHFPCVQQLAGQAREEGSPETRRRRATHRLYLQ